jgi:hypothetical protein
LSRLTTSSDRMATFNFSLMRDKQYLLFWPAHSTGQEICKPNEAFTCLQTLTAFFPLSFATDGPTYRPCYDSTT